MNWRSNYYWGEPERAPCSVYRQWNFTRSTTTSSWVWASGMISMLSLAMLIERYWASSSWQGETAEVTGRNKAYNPGRETLVMSREANQLTGVGKRSWIRAREEPEAARRTRRGQLHQQQETAISWPACNLLFAGGPQNVHLTLGQARPHNACISLVVRTIFSRVLEIWSYAYLWCELSPRSDFDISPIYRKLQKGKGLQKSNTIMKSELR